MRTALAIVLTPIVFVGTMIASILFAVPMSWTMAKQFSRRIGWKLPGAMTPTKS